MRSSDVIHVTLGFKSLSGAAKRLDSGQMIPLALPSLPWSQATSETSGGPMAARANAQCEVTLLKAPEPRLAAATGVAIIVLKPAGSAVTAFRDALSPTSCNLE